MKTRIAALLALLVGCGPEVGQEPSREAERVPSIGSTREIALALGDGYTFSTHYIYVPSAARLSGHWSVNGPGGFRSRDAEVILSPAQARALEARLSSLRLEKPTHPGGCWTDVVNLSVAFVEPSGSARLYYTDPDKESCAPSHGFIKKEDALSALGACRDLLPEPSL